MSERLVDTRRGGSTMRGIRGVRAYLMELAREEFDEGKEIVLTVREGDRIELLTDEWYVLEITSIAEPRVSMTSINGGRVNFRPRGSCAYGVVAFGHVHSDGVWGCDERGRFVTLWFFAREARHWRRA